MSNAGLYGNDELVSRLLADTEVWCVVGLGQDETRPAFGVAKFLQSIGKRIVPVHPRALPVHGETGYPTLAAALAAVGRIDVVDCFVASSRVGEIMRQARDLGLPAVWTQLEVVDEVAAAELVEAGVEVVMNRCPAIEWPRLMAGRGL